MHWLHNLKTTTTTKEQSDTNTPKSQCDLFLWVIGVCSDFPKEGEILFDSPRDPTLDADAPIVAGSNHQIKSRCSHLKQQYSRQNSTRRWYWIGSVSVTDKTEIAPFLKYRELSRFDCHELAWPRSENILVPGIS